MYESEFSPVKALTQAVKYFAFTTDLWTSRANHAYTGIIVHFVSASFDLHNFLVDTKEFLVCHMAVNIASKLQVILADWELNENSGN